MSNCVRDFGHGGPIPGLGIAGGAESRPGRRKARDCASVKNRIDAFTQSRLSAGEGTVSRRGKA